VLEYCVHFAIVQRLQLQNSIIGSCATKNSVPGKDATPLAFLGSFAGMSVLYSRFYFPDKLHETPWPGRKSGVCRLWLQLLDLEVLIDTILYEFEYCMA
jgi:hypothetical protein